MDHQRLIDGWLFAGWRGMGLARVGGRVGSQGSPLARMESREGRLATGGWQAVVRLFAWAPAVIRAPGQWM